MTLKDCTKEELIFIIEKFQTHFLTAGAYYLEHALSDVQLLREEKKCAMAKQLADVAHKKAQEYIELLAPYDGKRLVDIPASVLRKADAALKESQEADLKFFKIMGIK